MSDQQQTGLRILPALPTNANPRLVSRRRPITFYIITPLLSIFWTVVSLVWNLLALPIPRIRCFFCSDDEAERTRPRPPRRTKPARESQEESVSRFNAFSSLATGSRSLFGLTSKRARRAPTPKAARTPGFQPHELDNVVESDEDALEEEEHDQEEDGHPSLTPEASEGESDAEPSEADTLVDSVENGSHKPADKHPKERRFFSRKPKRGNSTDDDSAIDLGSGIGSSSAISGSSSASSTPASSISTRSGSRFCPKKSLRHAKSSAVSQTRPPLLATYSDPYPRHSTTEPQVFLDDRDRPPYRRSSTDSSSEFAPPSPVESTDTASSGSSPSASRAKAAKKPQSAAASFLRRPFRSRSPLSLSPNPSPPTSPNLAAPPTRRRSIDELKVDYLNLRVGRARARSELDDSGNSGLSMQDILRA